MKNIVASPFYIERACNFFVRAFTLTKTGNSQGRIARLYCITPFIYAYFAVFSFTPGPIVEDRETLL